MNWQSDANIGAQRYWPSAENGYTVWEPLTEAERASQRAVSNGWKVYGEELAAGAGRFAAAVPLFTEAALAGAKVAEDLYDRFTQVADDPNSYYLDQNMQGAGTGGFIVPGRQKRRNTGPVMDAHMNDATAGGTFQYTTRRLKSGRRMKKSRKVTALVKTETKNVIFRFSGINPYSGTYGYFRMWNQVDTTTQNLRVPLHMYDLTSVWNQNTGGLTFTPVGYELLLANTSTRWDSIRGSASNGTDRADAAWQVEESTVLGGTGGQIGDRAMHDWVDIRMMLYGMSSTLTKFKVAIVQFEDEDFCPAGNIPPTSTAVLTAINSVTSTEAAQYRWWAEYLRPWIFSPIMSGFNRERHMKVLKTYDVSLAPRLTTAGDTDTPSVHELRMFMRRNAMHKYRWDLGQSAVVSQLQEDGVNYVDNDLDTRPYVAPNKRVYLMVLSNAKFVSFAGGTPNSETGGNGNSPSYDLLIRSKYTTLDKL